MSSTTTYIVHFEDEAAQSLIDAAEAHVVSRGMFYLHIIHLIMSLWPSVPSHTYDTSGGKIVERYTETLRGFSASIPDDALGMIHVYTCG